MISRSWGGIVGGRVERRPSTLGWIWTLLLNGPIGVGAYRAAGRGFRQPSGLPRVLTASVLAWAWLTIGMETLGSLGWIGRGPLLAWSLIGLGLGLISGRRREEAAMPSPPIDRGASATIGLGMVVWSGTILAVSSLLLPVKVVSDGPIYHLLFAVRWWKEGTLSLIPTPFGENAAPYFPAVGDLWLTWLTVGWGGDRPARLGQVPFLVLAALAVVALSRRLGAGLGASTLAACWFVTSTPLFLFSFEPNVDTIFVAGYLMAAYFGLRYALRDGGAETLILAGLASGGAFGTKAPGIVFVIPFLSLMALVILARAETWPRRFSQLILLGLATAAMPGYFLGRNAWLTGNPLYPLHVEAFGRTWLAGWYGPEVMRLSKYFIPSADWRAAVDTLLALLDPRMAIAWLAALLGAWAIGRTGSKDRRWGWAAAGLALFNIALFWALVPYRTQQRFLFHAAGLAAVPLALLFDRSAILRALSVVLLALHLTTGQGWPVAEAGDPIPWDLSAQVPNSVHPPLTFPISRPAPGVMDWSMTFRLIGPKLLIGLGAFLTAWAIRRAIASPTSKRKSLAFGATVGHLGLAMVLLFPWGLSESQRFYPFFPDYAEGWRRLEVLATPGGSRIAYAGTNLPYYLMGTGLRNEVRSVNVDRHRGWLLHDYHREAIRRGEPTWPLPRPGWDRVEPDYPSWLANLEAEGIELLVVAKADPREGPHNIADREGFPVERRWADAHPEVFTPLYLDPLFRLYRFRPESDR